MRLVKNFSPLTMLILVLALPGAGEARARTLVSKSEKRLAPASTAYCSPTRAALLGDPPGILSHIRQQ